MSYGPNSALIKVELSPEVQAYKKAHDIGPLARRFLGPGDAASKQPVILGDLYDVTAKEALDYILQTFPGFWIYENCKTDEGERTAHFGFFKAVWRFACHFRRVLRNRMATCTRALSLQCWILLAVMPP